MVVPIKVKICGITNIPDRDVVVASGADYMGAIVGVPSSPRSLEPAQAAILFNTHFLQRVAVFVNPERDYLLRACHIIRPDAIQLHGKESPDFIKSVKTEWHGDIWKVFSIPASIHDKAQVAAQLGDDVAAYIEAGVNTILLDTKVVSRGSEKTGGTGQSFDWSILKDLFLELSVPLFIAGGITPENVDVLMSIKQVSGIDLSSGVESFPGKKDPAKIRRLMLAIRNGLSAGT